MLIKKYSIFKQIKGSHKNILRNQFSQQISNQEENDKQIVEEVLKKDLCILFMKGVPQMPACAYSQLAVEILKFYKIKEYKSYDILQETRLKDLVKEYSQWPTFPQFYFDSKLIGGSDILLEMHKDGSLQELVAKIKLAQQQQQS